MNQPLLFCWWQHMKSLVSSIPSLLLPLLLLQTPPLLLLPTLPLLPLLFLLLLLPLLLLLLLLLLRSPHRSPCLSLSRTLLLPQ
jgi:hypothetical protein